MIEGAVNVSPLCVQEVLHYRQDHPGDNLHHLDVQYIVGCFGDLEVEVCVAAGKGAHILSALCALFKQFPQQDNIFLRCILCCQTCGLDLDAFAELHDLQQVHTGGKRCRDKEIQID